MAKPVYLMVACSENRVIGREGQLPWSIPEDTRWYHDHTRGGVCIMGRSSFDETGVARPDCRTIVLTRQTGKTFPGAEVARDLDAALALAEQGDAAPIWICGGEAVYAEAMDRAERLYLTRVHAEVAGDARFPDWTHRFTRVIEKRTSADGDWRYTFQVLEPGSSG
ncbi:MAG: dihydrofolate reductase [Opitutales bacterium]